MHRVTYSIRRIADSDLPLVATLGGTPRQATDQELLSMGLAHLDGDLYSCAMQETRDDETLVWSVVGVPHPGTVLASGTFTERHAALPPAVREQLRRVVVDRPGRGLGAGRQRVRPTDVTPSDTVIATEMQTHTWHGERR